jgi:hypothetical protein
MAVAGTAAPALANDVNLNFYPVAARYLDEEFWDPVEEQYALGGTVDFGEEGWPLHFAIGLHGSVGDENFGNAVIDDVTGGVNEISFGVTKVWTPEGRTRPFLGGGVSFVHAEADASSLFGDLDDDDDSIGLWVEGGVYWRLGEHFNLGAFGRLLAGSDITLFGVEGDADYWEFGPMIGWSWPARK